MKAAAQALPGEASSGDALGLFGRWLTLWVFLCIVAGIALGELFPAPFQALGRMEIARVNIPVGLLIWVMIVPMLLKIDFGALHQVILFRNRKCHNKRIV